ncbi:diaminopimelate epimerase [Eubacterium sp. MSJ-13]|uniref:diaminopimelate epimerase n=1 Tax=Eubacterium sp. MSJ-13 TaxID=2841513 RepID=UPI001C0F9A85|nr:diaminopimelate epimerase [Eubacterium sp. MSJ-13]MBU5479307.1 diaminopimelate epimerase [Eubacterium sp. MSJ-13]
MKFTKMHGCGNDYVYVDCTKQMIENPGEVSKIVSHRHFGIGSDGLILICSSDVADFRMAMYNADGSEGAMCGNGIRCVAKYVYDKGLTDKKNLTIETKSGIKELELTVEAGKVSLVKVNMGAPILKSKDIPVEVDTEECIDADINVDGKDYKITCVSMGNPHAVTFIDEDVNKFPIDKVGPKFENHPMFPDRVNTEFVQVLNRHEVNMRVWERGSGETFACGTGTCATVVACVLNGLTDDEITVHLLGGDILVKYDRENDTVWMTGPAVIAFEGTIEI